MLVLQVPSACFVQPPLTYVGLTEEAAVAHLAGDLDIFVSKFRPLKYTISGRQEKTLMKIIVHVETNKARALQRLVGERSPCIRLPVTCGPDPSRSCGNKRDCAHA